MTTLACLAACLAFLSGCQLCDRVKTSFLKDPFERAEEAAAAAQTQPLHANGSYEQPATWRTHVEPPENHQPLGQSPWKPSGPSL